MYPAAGAPIWIFLGGIIGLIVAKSTRTDGPHGIMANVGVGALGAVISGFITTVFFKGERSTGGFWMAIVIASSVALGAVILYRYIFRNRPDPKLR